MHIFLFSIALSIYPLLSSLYICLIFFLLRRMSLICRKWIFKCHLNLFLLLFEGTNERTNERTNKWMNKNKKISLFCHHIFNIGANGCCGDVLHSFWICVRMCVVNWEILCASGVWIRITEMMYEVNWCPSTYVLTTLDQHYLTLARL